MKTCTKCQQAKPLSEFYPDRSKKCGIAARCKSCNLEYRKAWEARNPGRGKRRYWGNRDGERERHLVSGRFPGAVDVCREIPSIVPQVAAEFIKSVMEVLT